MAIWAGARQPVRWLALGYAAALMVMGAGAAPPPTLHGPRQPVAVPATGPWRLAWQAPTLREGLWRKEHASSGTPALFADLGRVLVGTGEAQLLGFVLATGAPAWRAPLPGPAHGAVMATAASAGLPALALVGAGDGSLGAYLPQDGQRRWQVPLRTVVQAAPAQDGGVVWLQGTDGQVVSLSLVDGSIRWRYQHPAPTGLTLAGGARPALDAYHVYVGTADAQVLALGRDDGQLRWRARLLGEGAFVDIVADLQRVDDLVLAAGSAAGLVALDAADGRQRWAQAAPGALALALWQGWALVGDAQGSLTAFAADHGRRGPAVWLGADPIVGLGVDGGAVWASGGAAGLVGMALPSLRPQQAMSLATARLGPLTIAGDAMAVLAGSGRLSVFARTGPMLPPRPR